MIETLEDRMHHVVDRDAEGWAVDAQVSDVVSKHLRRVITSSGLCMSRFGHKDFAKFESSLGKLLPNDAMAIVDSTLIVMHALGIDPPTLEDITDLVDEFEDVIAQDGVLSSCVITRAASDAMLCYFSDGEEMSPELVMSLGEIICGAALLVQRVGGDFNELVIRKPAS